MSRYNVFYRIHKGLRALLFDTSLLLQRTDFTTGEEAREAVSRLRFVIRLLERYLYWEDQYMLPAMTAYEPSLAIDFEQDHEEAYLAGKKLGSLLKVFANTPLPLEKITLSSEISVQFEELTVSALLYMGREQQAVNKALWRYYTDAELQAIAWKLINQSEASLMLPYIRWMIRGLNNNEIIRWVKEVKQTADKDDFIKLLKAAEEELTPVRWNVVLEVLTAGAMVA